MAKELTIDGRNSDKILAIARRDGGTDARFQGGCVQRAAERLTFDLGTRHFVDRLSQVIRSDVIVGRHFVLRLRRQDANYVPLADG